MILWIFKAQLITDCGHTIQFQLGGTLVEPDDPTCVSSNKRPTMSVVEIPSSAQTAALPTICSTWKEIKSSEPNTMSLNNVRKSWKSIWADGA